MHQFAVDIHQIDAKQKKMSQAKKQLFKSFTIADLDNPVTLKSIQEKAEQIDSLE